MMVVSLTCALASCNRELIQDNGFGYLGISLDNDLTAETVTKAPGDELVFSIDVISSSGRVVATRDDHRTTAADPIQLQSGSYEVVAKSGVNLNAAFDNPYYEGRTEESVKIIPGQTRTVEVNCSLANTIFSAQFSEAFKSFNTYEVSVTNGIGDKLVFSNRPVGTNEAGFDALAYFAVTGTLTYDIYVKNSDGGEWSDTKTINDVKAKQHYHLFLDLGDSGLADGALLVKVSLNNEWVDKGDNNLNLDFSKKSAPEISSNDAFGAVSDETVLVPYGDQTKRSLTFSAGYGFSSLMLVHNNITLLELGLPRNLELVGAASDQLAALNQAGISLDATPSGEITESTVKLIMDFTQLFLKLPLGTYDMTFTLKDPDGTEANFYLKVLVDQDDVETLAPGRGWTAFAQFNAKLNNADKKNVATFQYKKVSASNWIDVNLGKIEHDASNSTYSALVYGLEPSTQYEYRAVSDEDVVKSIKFTTASYETLHNMSFDAWTKSNKFPNAEGYAVWDSANSTNILTTTTPVDDAVSGKAARLESKNAATMFAAGNIFTGDFLKAVMSGNVGATLDWGTPFNGRPLALRGYYKYSPKAIDYTSSNFSHLKGQTDQCQILVCLTDWDAPFTVNTAKEEFVDFDNDEGIIAYGVFNTSEASSEYVEFTIPIVYRSNSRIPAYAIIAGASSRFGDYFTGAKGSVLFLDEFEFVYDPAELTDAEFNQVFSIVDPF